MVKRERVEGDQSQDPKSAADAARENFEAEQKARAARFEQEQEASANVAERRSAEAAEKAEAREKVAAMQQANDELAYRHGYLRDEDLPARMEFVRQHGSECQMPHQVLIGDEDMVKMAFPRSLILNLHSPEPDTTIHTGHKVLFPKGYNDVPESISDHPYLYDNGVRRVDDDGKLEPESDRAARLKSKQAKADKADAKAAKSKE